MKAPVLQYARSLDGHVAYATFGEGDIDLLVTLGYFASVPVYWDYPPAASALERLGRLGRVIMLDLPGSGASDAAAGTDMSDGFVRAARAVLDAVGAARVTHLGQGSGGRLAYDLAVAVPERVERCVTVNAPPRQPAVVTSHGEELLDNLLWNDDPGDKFLRFVAPSVANDAAFIDWYRAAGRGASPGFVEKIHKQIFGREQWDVVAAVESPLTMLHAARSTWAPDHGELWNEVAEWLPHAAVVPVDTADQIAFSHEWPKYHVEIEAAITGRHTVATDRRLATVVFTDLVDSTARAAELGDERWRGLLDQHDHLCTSVVRRHGGDVVKSTGDGQLATFDTPSVAVDAACALVEALADIGLPTRAGVHLGEIEVRGDDVGGLAVNLAARVCGAAGSGEVWVTESVRQGTLGGAHTFEAAGEHELKGVPGSWMLSRLA